MFQYCFSKCVNQNKNDNDSKEVNNEENLRNFDYKSIPLFSFNDTKTICRVVDVYDGDTCTIIFNFKVK